MMTTKFKAVELVRRIRDAHYEQLKGKTHAERIAFYHAKAQAIQAKITSMLQKLQSTTERLA